jgi:hypothetical protein
MTGGVKRAVSGLRGGLLALGKVLVKPEKTMHSCQSHPDPQALCIS